MRVFKFFIVCVIATMTSLCITSCSKEYSSPLKGQIVKDLTFDSSQSSNSITIADADLTGFTIKSSELWCTASAKGKVLTVTVQTNDTYEDRQATISVTDPEDQTAISFKVFQKQNDAILIDGSTFVVPEEGGEVSIKVQSNVNYDVEIPASASWLTVSTKASTRGLVSSTIVLTAEKNNSGEEREAIVTIIDKKSGISSKITIKQSLTPYIEIDKDQISLSENEKDIEIAVKTNIKVETIITDNWITDNGKDSNGDLSFIQKLKVSAFSGRLSRSTVVTFKSKDNKLNLEKKVTITQTKEVKYVAKEVDLGLSVLWSDYNLGATVPEEYGEYFAWGETQPKETYLKDNYLYYNLSMEQYIDIGQDISGTKYDAAHVNLGNGWRMPTIKEFKELRDNCIWEWVQISGSNGYKITGPNGKYIFLPAGGYRIRMLAQENTFLQYWTSTVDSTFDVYELSGNSSLIGFTYFSIRTEGYTIRPVKSK